MFKKIRLIFIYLFIVSLFSTSIIFASSKTYKIVRLVNDQVITNYDLENRLKLFSFLNSININNENIDHYANEMLKLMVEEKLQIEQLKKYNIVISDNEVENYIKEVYASSNENILDFKNSLSLNNIKFDIFKESIRIQIAWNELAGRLFYRSLKVSEADIKNLIEKNPSITSDQARNMIIQKQINLRAKKLLRDLKTEANIEIR